MMYNGPIQNSQAPRGPMMPPMQNRQAPRGWRERWMHRFGMDVAAAPLRKGELTIPNWLTGKAMAFFFVALFACWGAFGHVPEFDLWLVSCISVVLFFYGGSAMSKSWSHTGEKRFLRNVFIAGFLIRILWILYCYFIFNPEYFDNTYGDKADVDWYMAFGKDLALWLSGESPHTLLQVIDINQAAIDDTGYPMWLGVLYLLTGNASDVFIPFVVKSIVSAYCAICIYNIAKRHFGEGTARMAAIFVCLNPNMIYWCGRMMKETEMVFVVCLAVDNFDKVFTSGNKMTFKAILPGLLAGMYLFFFRTALAMVLFLAVFSHIVMASNRVMSLGKKILAGILVGAVLVVGIGERVQHQAERFVHLAQSDAQKQNMEWRSNSKTGNALAKYAGAAVFAPLIFTIPFPTFNQSMESQVQQVQCSGGNYIKNILSFFVILVMFMLLISGEWRRHVFIIAYTCGYLMALVLSNFAHSGRFHMPIWPMLMLFAAYGIQVAKTNPKLRKWWPIVLVLEVIACLGWNWFKLKGRGVI